MNESDARGGDDLGWREAEVVCFRLLLKESLSNDLFSYADVSSMIDFLCTC